MIPKIEDGNNFGVSIQEDTLAEIQSVESEAAAFFDQISRYFISRAKIVSKVAKYPHIDDYRRAVRVSKFAFDSKLYNYIDLKYYYFKDKFCCNILFRYTFRPLYRNVVHNILYKQLNITNPPACKFFF